MTNAERSAYAILGVRPGAGRAEVNIAYRRLIKRYHPDRPGGDSNRAAEINRAYTFLRRRLGEPVRVPVAVPIRRRAGPARFRRAASLFTVLIIGVAIAVVSRDGHLGTTPPAFLLFSEWNRTPPVESDGNYGDAPLADFEEPVQPRIVANAVADALRFHAAGNLSAAVAYSRDCQISLRRERKLGWFDACAAFDEAMLTLYGDSGKPDSSAFNEAAVVAREIAAARILSDDTLAADSHLHQIRSQVDIAILPMLDSAAAPEPQLSGLPDSLAGP